MTSAGSSTVAGLVVWIYCMLFQQHAVCTQDSWCSHTDAHPCVLYVLLAGCMAALEAERWLAVRQHGPGKSYDDFAIAPAAGAANNGNTTTDGGQQHAAMAS